MPLLLPLCFGVRIPVFNVQHKYYCLELLSPSNHFLFEQDSHHEYISLLCMPTMKLNIHSAGCMPGQALVQLRTVSIAFTLLLWGQLLSSRDR